jgi:thiamine-monophosphate kinase
MVNLSDLAAMGARPRWATLAIALPEIDEPWLAAFSEGFFKCAGQYGIALVGGDTTRGPLTLSVTILGEVPAGQALRRDGAKPGDDIWVSGHLGDAALALAALQGRVALDEASLNHCRRALETPLPRVELGLALRGTAHAAIDISDGLLADLGHILERSCTGAEIHFDAIPRAAALQPLMDSELGRNCLLAGGDDYELCFTAPPSRQDAISAISGRLGVAFTRIGSITQNKGLRLLDGAGRPMPTRRTGYDHFA